MSQKKTAPTPGAFHSDAAIPVARRRREFAQALVEMIDEARGLAQYTAAAGMAKQLAELTGIDPAQARRSRRYTEPADPIDGMRLRLRAVVDMRHAAEAKGSYVAAKDLIRTEVDLLRQLAELERARPRPAEIPDDELVALIATDLQALPPPMRAAVLARLR